MRNIRTSVLHLVFAAALAATAWPAGRAWAADHPTIDALAEEPLAVLRVDSLAGAAREMAETRIGRHVSEDPVLSGMADIWRGSRKMLAALLTDFSQPTLERLLSREAALVLFEWNGVAQEPPVALVVYLGGDADLVREAFDEQFVPRALALNPGLEVSKPAASGGDYTVRATDAGKDTYFRFTDDLLVIGPKSVVQKFRAGGTAPAWLTDRTPGEDLAYVSVNLVPVWNLAMQVGDRAGLQAVGATALTDIQIATTVADGGFKDTAVATVSGTPTGILGALTSLQPGSTDCAGVVPDDYSLLASVQVESGEKLLGVIEDTVLNMGGDQALQQFRNGMDQIDQGFAVNVEWELLPGVGHELFLAMKTPSLEMLGSGRKPAWGDFQPIFGFAVKDQVILADLVRRFVQSPVAMQQGWRLITTGYGDYEIYTLENMAFNFHLSLVFVNGYCVLSLDRGLVTAALDAIGEGATLAAEAQYKSSRQHVAQDVNAYFYLDTRPAKEAVITLLRRRLPPKAMVWVGALERAIPDLGGYSLAMLADGSSLRVEGYGELPVAFSGLSLLAVSGAVQTQKLKGHLQ